MNLDNLLNFLRLPNVACVGGTWLAPPSLIRARAWDQITQLAREARELAGSLEQH
ncbi:4-hydroxy-2-ketovalerate aldolase [Klebsiella pneumoniae]|nr:4-hydroxy-2-ketovalerate aldolase [Klebsiella pneumoniae]